MKWANIIKAFITIIGCFFFVEVVGQVPDKTIQNANCEQVLNLIDELQEKNFSDTLLILKEAKNLSICLLKSNDYSSSIKGAEKLLKVVETRFKGSFFIEYVHILLNLGKFFQTNEKYSTNIYEKAFFEINKRVPINQQNNTLKACYMIIGNFFASKSWRDGTGKSNYTEKAEKCYRECFYTRHKFIIY